MPRPIPPSNPSATSAEVNPGGPPSDEGEGSGLRDLKIRTSPGLHEALKREAKLQRVTVSKLAAEYVALGLGARYAGRPGDLTEDEILPAILARTSEARARALKQIAQGAERRGAVMLAALLELVAAEPDHPASSISCSKAIGALGSSLERKGFSSQVVDALLELSAVIDPENLESITKVGFRAYLDGRYDDAHRLLESAAQHEPRAELFFGLATLKLGDTTGFTRIEAALKKWARSNRSARDRSSWVEQLRRIAQEWPGEYDAALEELVTFANERASWGRIDAHDVIPSEDGD